MRKIKSGLLITGVLCGVAASVQAQQYNVIDLGPLNGATLGYESYGENSLGQAVGCTQTFSQANSFIPAGTANNLGNLGGTQSVQALGINTSGLIVGASTTTAGINQGFTYSGTGPMTSIGSLNGGTYGSGLHAVNDAGVAVGNSDGFNGSTTIAHAITYTAGGGIVDLGQLPGGSTFGYGINAQGDVVGGGTATGGQNHGWADIGGAGLTDIGTLPGGTQSVLFAINNSDYAVGYSTTGGIQDAISWTPGGGIVNLGTLAAGSFSYPESVNDYDAMVGYGSAGGFLWTPGTGFLNLNTLVSPTSGWNLQRGYGINDAGDIVGYGTYTGEGTTVKSAFELVPVPEPTSIGLLGLGGIALLGRWRSRRSR